MSVSFQMTDENPSEFNVASIASAFRHGWAATSLLVFLGLALAGAYVVDTIPLYTASASVLVDPYRPQSTLVPEPLSDAPVDEAIVDTQVELIKSEAVARLAIQRLGPDADALLLGVKTSNVKAFKNWVTNALKSRGGDSAPPDHTLDLIIALEDALYVKRTGLTFIIDVSFQGETATGAARVANAIAAAYLDDQINAKIAAAERVSDLLSKRAEELRILAEEADRKVQAFQGNDRVTLQHLTLAAEAAQSTFETFQRRAMETQQAGDNSTTIARLVSPAAPPDKHSWPRTSLILLGAIFVGLFLGQLIALARQRFGRRYANGAEIELELGKFIGVLRLRSASRLRRLLRRGDLARAELLAALDDTDSGFSDVARRVSVELDRLLVEKKRPSVGVLAFGSDVNGGALALWLALSAVKVRRATVLIEAQQDFRLLPAAWGLKSECSPLALHDTPATDPAAPTLLFGLSLSPREASDMTPARVRDVIAAATGEERTAVVSFSDHDLGSIAAWIAGLDAFVMVLQRKRTRRSYVTRLKRLCPLAEKCAGVILC